MPQLCNHVASKFYLPLGSMKLTAQILLFYMLSLSFVPCGDGGGGIMEIAEQLFGMEHHSGHGHEHDKESEYPGDCNDDHCSPICVCNCCSTVFDPPTELGVVIKKGAAISHQVPVLTSLIKPSAYLDAIWQPPRIS